MNSEAPSDLCKNASWHQAMQNRIGIVIFGVRWRQQVLPYNAEFERLSHPPSEPRIESCIAGRRSAAPVLQWTDLIDRQVPFQMACQVQAGTDLKLVLG